MHLAGQTTVGGRVPPDGYAMVALLVAMSIMAVMMTAVMPVWKQTVQREKEEELVFRGKQYVHAIELYGRKYANTQPPSFDVLVQQRFLRRKYKDPITNGDFQPVMAIQSTQAQGGQAPGGTQGSRGTSPGGAGTSQIAAAQQPASRGTSPIGTPGSGPTGGIVGVMSKSKDKSIRLYNGRSHYNEWVFVYQGVQRTTDLAPGASLPGQRGGAGRPGGPGFPGGVGGRGFRGNPSPPPTGTSRGRK